MLSSVRSALRRSALVQPGTPRLMTLTVAPVSVLEMVAEAGDIAALRVVETGGQRIAEGGILPDLLLLCAGRGGEKQDENQSCEGEVIKFHVVT